jgi:predicted nucleotidyltransferase component of viral defense system
MNEWQAHQEDERRQVINTISFQNGLSPNAIEKDWWVTMALKAIFQTSCSEYLVFKGGTSLSKGWDLIKRFSEDCDLAIYRSFFGMSGELTRKEQTKLRKMSCRFIREKLSVEIDEILQKHGIVDYTIIVPQSIVSDLDPQDMYIEYQSLFPEIDYIKNQVKLEISCRSLREPLDAIPIRSIVADFHNIGEDYFPISFVSPKRTFLEKIFLLHEEFQLNRHSKRMSRHLYDLEKLMDTEFAFSALNDMELYKSIVKHRMIFNKWKDIDYTKHHPSSIHIIPPDSMTTIWEEDYKNLQHLFIYGKSLLYEQLLQRMKELEQRLHHIKLDNNFLNFD